MAKKLRVSRGKYRRIEEKPGETQFRTAIEICKVLDMSLSDIDFLAN
nr:MAG TPA: SOS-response transcriptional repressor [Caudoviricetes sp.]